MRFLPQFAAAATLLLLAVPIARAGNVSGYVQSNLVSDIPGMAQVTDPNLKNPWGVAFGGTTAFWVSNQATNTASLYSFNGTTVGEPNPPGVPTGNFVNVPPEVSTPPNGPTGVVFAGGAGFTIPAANGGGSPNFIFSTLDGSIEAWVAGHMNAQLGVQVPGAIFTGLALGMSGGSNFLYAADDKNGAIDVFNTSFTNVTNTMFAGKFVDPNLPAGFTPFNIQLLNGNLYVAYAHPNGIVQGPGGFVDEYDKSGNLIARLVSDPTGTMLNGPWGMAIAPSTFGPAAGDLLVGNFGNATATGGNGTIAAFSLSGNTATFVGDLADGSGNPIAIPGLWSLEFGNNGSAGSSNVLDFTAGINGQADGLVGELSAVPEPASAIQATLGLVIASAYLAYWRRRRAPARP
jgi:uncharacterized protein (TIGR03118 family)